jgi:hypothetical protein
MVASYSLAKGSHVAAFGLVLTALTVAAGFEHSYRAALARHQARISAETRSSAHDRRAAFAMQHDLIALNRKIAWLSAGLGVLYLGAVVVVWRLRQLVPRPKPTLNRRQRLMLWISSMRARMAYKAVLYFALGIVCMLIVLGPALGLLAGLLLRVSPSGLFAILLNWQYDWWSLILSLLCVVAGLMLCARAKRYAALPLTRARALDPRSPILLLRSFQDDITPLQRTNDPRAWMRSLLVPSRWTLEETIERLLGSEGPVIAIGRPGESLPPAGAARTYVADDQWRDRVQAFIAEAALVVVILGETAGLRFEYDAIVRLGALDKLMAIFPVRDTKALHAIWRRFADTVAADHVLSELDVSQAVAMCFQDGVQPVLVSCSRRDDEDCYHLVLQYCLALLRPGIPLQNG